MDQLKFSLGPYELFSSILAGAPQLLCLLLLYRPISGMAELLPIIKDNSSFSIAATIILSCYLLGSLSSGITWNYFLFLCWLFGVDYSYFGKVVLQKMAEIKSNPERMSAESLDFEERLAVLLLKKIGSIEALGMLDARLIPYLRLHSLPTISVVETYLAQHIMLRALSFGFLLLTIVLAINIFRVPVFRFEQILMLLGAFLISLLAFRRSISFRKWRYREILLTFYHLASGEKQKGAEPA